VPLQESTVQLLIAILRWERATILRKHPQHLRVEPAFDDIARR
jgi:hypothetical protein